MYQYYAFLCADVTGDTSLEHVGGLCLWTSCGCIELTCRCQYMSIYCTGINCEGVPKTQNGQTKMKFPAQDLHTMTATIRTQTRDVTSF